MTGNSGKFYADIVEFSGGALLNCVLSHTVP